MVESKNGGLTWLFPCAYNVSAVETPGTKKSGCQQVETQLDAGSKESTRSPLADTAPSEPSDRYRQLCDLLAQVEASGPAPFEPDIDRIRQYIDLSETEREVVAKIFRRGFEAALLKADQHKSWAYQRLLRRLLVGQPLDCPIIGDNPYATLNHRKLPVVTFESETSELRGLFAYEEGVEGRKSAWKAGALTLARSRRLPYAIAINLLALALWLGPLNDSGRVKNQDRSRANKSADLQQDRTASAASQAIGSVMPNLPGANHLQDSGNWRASTSERTSVAAIAPIGAAKATNVTLPANIKAAPVARLAESPAVPSPSAVFQAAQEIGLRNEPQHSAPKGKPLQPGTRLEVIATAGQWLKVRCESDGKVGYVRKEFVEPISPET